MAQTRRVYSTHSPYTPPEWPQLPHADEALFVNLLCDVLQPIGHYRREYVKPSRGKSDSLSRPPKRRATPDECSQLQQERNPHGEADAAPDLVAPIPEIISWITIGFNTTVRHLEALSTVSNQLSVDESAQNDTEPSRTAPSTLPVPLTAVFVCCEGSPAVLTSSMPFSAAAASLAHPKEPAIRLIPLGQASEQRLAKALHQPKVGFIGVKQGCPGLTGLTALVQEKVAAIDVPWLRQVRAGAYLPLNVLETEANIGPKRSKDSTQRRRAKGFKKRRKKPLSKKVQQLAE